ncbi:hypothetical protein [Lysinibacillus xylanilyticus]|uniref:hypothetical protein n=1 Tax=Lysinibacillus xylanilyticus TaxID=582475 RepID=UPI0036DB3F82
MEQIMFKEFMRQKFTLNKFLKHFFLLLLVFIQGLALTYLYLSLSVISDAPTFIVMTFLITALIGWLICAWKVKTKKQYLTMLSLILIASVIIGATFLYYIGDVTYVFYLIISICVVFYNNMITHYSEFKMKDLFN